MVLGIGSLDSAREQFIEKLQSAGITQAEFESAKSQGANAFEQLLQSHGITEADLPPEPTVNNNGHDEFMQKLQAAGITQQEFEAAKAQGPDAVRQLLESHGIKPPKGKHHCHKQESNNDDNLVQKLESAGISDAEFQKAVSQGPLAIQQLLQSYGIQPSKVSS
jgi:bacterioferritin-associated ferredoxin